MDAVNLAERSASVTAGDILLRINGLLRDCASDTYELVEGLHPTAVYEMVSTVLDAAGLKGRLRDAAEGSEPGTAVERLRRVCAYSLTGLSGGEQQRLRLASLFLVERIRFQAALSEAVSWKSR
jgi:hypothetical protein